MFEPSCSRDWVERDVLEKETYIFGYEMSS